MGFQPESQNWEYKYPKIENFLVLKVAPIAEGKGMIYLENMKNAWAKNKESGIALILQEIADDISVPEHANTLRQMASELDA